MPKKKTIITTQEGKQFALLGKLMEETRSVMPYRATRSEIREMFESGINEGEITYQIGRHNPDRNTAQYRIYKIQNEVVIGCCSFRGEDATKLQEWATSKTNKNEENDRMITVKNDCEEVFTLGATEMRQSPNGYKMSRQVLKEAMEQVPHTVRYGYTGATDETHMAIFKDDGDHIMIGCCDFYRDEAQKLRKWAMAERKSNGRSTGTRKRTGTGKNSNRKNTQRTTAHANRARTSKARPRKKKVAARANRSRKTVR